MVALRVTRAPEFVQVAGKTAGRGDDDVAIVGRGLDEADDLGLAEGRVSLRVGSLDSRFHSAASSRQRASYAGSTRQGSRRAASASSAARGVRDHGHCGELGGVEGRHVDVDELHVGALEGYSRGTW